MEKSHKTTLPCDDALFGKFKLFADLTREELQTLLEQTATITAKSGEQIIKTGEPGLCMYVIVKGRAKVSESQLGRTVELATLGAGDFFGEVALVDDGPRSADVVAIEDCELLCITRTTLGVLAGLQPGAAIHLLASIGRLLVARLRVGHQKYLDLLALGGQSS